MTEPERRERLLTFLQALKDHYAQMRQETAVEVE